MNIPTNTLIINFIPPPRIIYLISTGSTDLHPLDCANMNDLTKPTPPSTNPATPTVDSITVKLPI
jgi:hypothetical protein